MRQAGVLAAAGIVAMNTTAKNLHKVNDDILNFHSSSRTLKSRRPFSLFPSPFQDHEKNYLFAESLAAFDNDIFTIDIDKSQTNMTMLNMQNGYNPTLFCSQLETVRWECSGVH